jgi:CYTH domain-containing protein
MNMSKEVPTTHERLRIRHQVRLQDPIHFDSVEKQKEYELKFHPQVTPPFLRDAMSKVQPVRIEQIYVEVPVITKKGKSKVLEGRIRRVTHPETNVLRAFSLEKKKKRKGVGVNGEAELIMSRRERDSLLNEFPELLRTPTVPKAVKMRYEVVTALKGLEHEVRYHVDVFEGDLAGLVLVEVEFESRADEKKYLEQVPEGLRGSEVTDIKAFRNSHLAFFGVPRGSHEELRKAQSAEDKKS